MNGRSWAPIVTGALLVLVGAAWLLAAAGVVDVGVRTGFGALLVGLGLAIVLVPRGAAPLVVLAIPLFLVGLLLVSVDPGRFSGGVGERREAPSSAADLADEYELGIGRLVVDLTSVELEEAAGLRVTLGIGELVVELPDGLSVDVRAETGAGNMRVLGDERNGIGLDVDVEEARGGGTLDLTVELGIGDLQVRRR